MGRWARVLPGLALPALTLGILLALFPGVFLGGETFADRDLSAYDWPERSLLKSLVSEAGWPPLWNPYFASGQPFAANPRHEVFHPVALLFLALPFELAFALQVLVPLVLGGLSMRFLLRTIGASQAAAALSGLSWAVSGFSLSFANLLPMLFVAAARPATLAFAIRAARTRHPLDVAGLGLLLGLEVMAGEPVMILSGAILIPAALLAETGLLAEAARARAAAVGRLLLGAAIGMLLSAPTWLPGLALWAKTVRAAGVPDPMRGLWAFPIVRIPELVAPHLFGRPADQWISWLAGLYPRFDFPFIYSLYPGLLVTALALLPRRPARREVVWAVASSAGFLLAMGSNGPVWPALLRLAPPLEGLRYAEKLLHVGMLPLVVLAGLVLDRVRVDARLAGRLRGLLRGIALVSLIAAGGVLRLDEMPWPWDVSSEAGPFVARGLVVVALLAVLLVAALVWARRFGPRGLPVALLLLTAADLAWAGRSLIRTRRVSELTTPPAFLLPLVRRPPGGPLFHYTAWLDEVGGGPGTARPPIPVQWGIPLTLQSDYELTELTWSRRGTELFLEAVSRDRELLAPLLERRGAAGVVMRRDGVMTLALLPKPGVFAFCASGLALVPTDDGWPDCVRRLGARAATTAILTARVAKEEGVPAVVSGGAVTSLLRSPERHRLRVEASGPGPCLLLINQTWDPLWRLALDGAPARLFRADVALSAALVPPGTHQVDLSYEDRRVTLGLVLAGIGGLAVGALLLAARGARRT